MTTASTASIVSLAALALLVACGKESTAPPTPAAADRCRGVHRDQQSLER